MADAVFVAATALGRAFGRPARKARRPAGCRRPSRWPWRRRACSNCICHARWGRRTAAADGVRVIEEVSKADGSVGWCTMSATVFLACAAWLPVEVGCTLCGGPRPARGGLPPPPGAGVAGRGRP